MSLWRIDGRLRFSSCSQQREAQPEQLRTAPVGQEPEVPDAHKTPRQHVSAVTHQPLFVVMRRVAPAEHDLSVLQGHQAVIRDRYAVCCGGCSVPSGSSTQNARSAEPSTRYAISAVRRRNSSSASPQCRECSRRGQRSQATMEAEFAGRVVLREHYLNPGQLTLLKLNACRLGRLRIWPHRPAARPWR
jgi:hypothetical protein